MILYSHQMEPLPKGRAMTTLAETKTFIRDYIENSGFEVRDENALDDAARELRDLCDEQGAAPDEVDTDEFCAIVEKYDI